MIRGGIVTLLLLLLMIAFYVGRSGRVTPVSTPAHASQKFPDVALTENKLSNGVVLDRESDFSKHYGAENSSIKSDLRILGDILERTIVLVKNFANLPLAGNRDFTKLLIGNNKQGFAWIHPDHPAVTSEGELIDRLGTPLFFHRTSALTTEIRSAGQDREMWTADDVVLAPDRLDSSGL